MNKFLLLLLSLAIISCAKPSSEADEMAITLAAKATPAVTANEYYVTISSENITVFNAAVNAAFRQGYVPVNGVAVTMSSGGSIVRYTQSMVNSRTVTSPYTTRTVNVVSE